MIAVSYCVKFQGWNIGKLNAEEAIIMETKYEDWVFKKMMSDLEPLLTITRLSDKEIIETYDEFPDLFLHEIALMAGKSVPDLKEIFQQQRHIKELRGAL